MSKVNNLIKDTIIFAIGGIGSKFILFLMVPLYTHFLTTEQYGTSELTNTIVQLLVPFLSMMIFEAVTRFGFSSNVNKKDVFKNAFTVICIGSLISIIITPLLAFYESIATWKWYVCINVILSMHLSLLLNYLKINNKNLIYASSSLLQTLVLAICNILFLKFKNLGIKGYLSSTVISYCVSVVFCFIFSDAKDAIRNGKIDKKMLKEMMVYSVPLIFNNISWWIIHSSDKIMTEMMISSAALGIYTVSSKIPSLVNVVTSIFQQSWGISSIKEIESTNSKKFIEDVFLYLQTFVFLMCICIIMIIKPFMKIYVDNNFYSAWIYVPILLLASTFNTISSYFGTLYGALKKSLNNMITTIIGGLVNIICNYIFIKLIGIWGASLGTLISYIVVTIIRMIDCSKISGLKVNYRLFIVNSIIVSNLVALVSFNINIYIVSIITLIIFSLINYKIIKSIIKYIFGLMYKRIERKNCNDS